MVNWEKFIQACNVFYYIIYKVKRKCQQNFLEGEKRDSDISKIRLEDENRCWIALKYIKPQTSSNTLTLKGSSNEIAILMQIKDALIRAYAFFNLLVFQKAEYQLYKKQVHLLIIEDMIQDVLFCQSTKKAQEPNLYSFLIFCLLCD